MKPDDMWKRYEVEPRGWSKYRQFYEQAMKPAKGIWLHPRMMHIRMRWRPCVRIRLHRGDGVPYVERLCVLPYNRWFNIYVHKYLSPDDAVPHDHPFDFIGLTLRGGGTETIWGKRVRTRRMRRWIPRFYRAECKHTITGLDKKGMTTVVFQFPRRRPWRFYPELVGEAARATHEWMGVWEETIFPWRGK